MPSLPRPLGSVIVALFSVLSGCTLFGGSPGGLCDPTETTLSEGDARSLVPAAPVKWNAPDPVDTFALAFWMDVETRASGLTPEDSRIAAGISTTRPRAHAMISDGFRSSALTDVWRLDLLVGTEERMQEGPQALNEQQVAEDLARDLGALRQEITEARASPTSTTVSMYSLAERYHGRAADLAEAWNETLNSPSSREIELVDKIATIVGAEGAIGISRGILRETARGENNATSWPLPNGTSVERLQSFADEGRFPEEPCFRDPSAQFHHQAKQDVERSREYLELNWTEGAWTEARRALAHAATEHDLRAGTLPPAVDVADLERIAREDPSRAIEAQRVAAFLWLAQQDEGPYYGVLAGELFRQLQAWWTLEPGYDFPEAPAEPAS